MEMTGMAIVPQGNQNEITQELTHELEDLIRRAPDQWHVLEDRFA